jgi:hypothetical protein
MHYFSPTDLPLVYSPIRVQFVQPFRLSPDDEDLTDYSQYYLKIIPPVSNRPGVNYYLKESFTINIPADGLLSLELIPSDRFLPIGRYAVEYYRKGNPVPLDKQNWIIPLKPFLSSTSVLYESGDITLPYNIWSIAKVTPAQSFRYENNILTAFGEMLEAGITLLNITFQPALTLDEIIERT